MKKRNCNYSDCKKPGEVKGFVVSRSGAFVPVSACDKHKELNSFFPEVVGDAATIKKTD